MRPGGGSAPGALITAGDEWRAVPAAKDQVIAAQAATIGAQAQTIAALLAQERRERARWHSTTPPACGGVCGGGGGVGERKAPAKPAGATLRVASSGLHQEQEGVGAALHRGLY